MTSPGSIDVVLDHLALAPAGADGRSRPLPGLESMLAEAGRIDVPVRLALLSALDDDAVRGLHEILPFVGEIVPLEDLVPPEGAGPHVYVAADRVLRDEAAHGGWEPVAHPALALPALLGHGLQFARLSGDLDALPGVPGVVPYWVERGEDGAWAFALLTDTAAEAAAAAGITVEPLPLRHEVQDALLVQLDEGAAADVALAAYAPLWCDGSRALLALDAQTSPDEIPAHGAHGHFRLLTPTPELLRPARVARTRAAAADDRAAPAEPEPAPVTAQSFAADVDRYAGAAPLRDGPPVRSRHSSHADNPRVVQALLDDLRELGLAPVAHEFMFARRRLHNVIADVPGQASSLVVVGCHLDSTAARDAGFDPARGPARGADDDGSGMAAVLAIARHLVSAAARPHHTVRLGFFNAEESGLVGSRAYAASLKATGAEIAAVVCVDMIGWNSDALRTFEVHAGFTDPAVRDLSAPLAAVVARAAASLGALPPAQVYTGTRPTGGTDPTRFDGAINRSDHASFQEQGWPAVLVSEDFFPNRPGEPDADPNPNYHSNADAVIDAAYAADITRAVSVAVLELAAG